MRRIKLISKYFDLTQYYELIITSNNYIKYKAFKILTKYYKKGTLNSTTYSSLHSLIKIFMMKMGQ